MVEIISFKTEKKIASQLIADRIETVKELKQDDLELYEVIKDKETGEHYLHYSYLHRDLASSGEPEIYHQLLPLESDDVISLIFGEEGYVYPDHWNHSFLRNGPDGFYIWFDPSYDEEREKDEAIGEKVIDKLKQFKQAGAYDEDSIRKLLEELDKDRG